MSKYEIVMVRHGESEWNQKNLFCGWFDADLSENGRKEAAAAGKALNGLFWAYFIQWFGHTFDQTAKHLIRHPYFEL